MLALNTPAIAQELAAWWNGLIGQDIEIPNLDILATFRLLGIEELDVLPQPDGQATAIALLDIVLAKRITRNGTLLA